jgi:pyruvate carboxylase
VQRTCSCLALQVAVYSPADRLQPHRYKADESYCVGTADMPPVSCYLDVEAIIKLAKEADVDAIHPGYGFLSENATFARRCAEEGITFIGPKPETITVCCCFVMLHVGLDRQHPSWSIHPSRSNLQHHHHPYNK